MAKIAILQNIVLDDKESFQWYTIVTKFNNEKKFRDDVLDGLKNNPILNGKIKEIVVPIKEELIEKLNANGKPITRKKVTKIYPNYVFVNCILDDDVWSYFKNKASMSCVLASAGVPAKVESNYIDNIKSML